MCLNRDKPNGYFWKKNVRVFLYSIEGNLKKKKTWTLGDHRTGFTHVVNVRMTCIRIVKTVRRTDVYVQWRIQIYGSPHAKGFRHDQIAFFFL